MVRFTSHKVPAEVILACLDGAHATVASRSSTLAAKQAMLIVLACRSIAVASGAKRGCELAVAVASGVERDCAIAGHSRRSPYRWAVALPRRQVCPNSSIARRVCTRNSYSGCPRGRSDPSLPVADDDTAFTERSSGGGGVEGDALAGKIPFGYSMVPLRCDTGAVEQAEGCWDSASPAGLGGLENQGTSEFRLVSSVFSTAAAEDRIVLPPQGESADFR